MALPLAQTLVSSFATTAASKALETAAGKPNHTKSYISLGGGAVLLALYFMSSGAKLKYIDMPKKWALYGGLVALAYGVYCFYKYKGQGSSGGVPY